MVLKHAMQADDGQYITGIKIKYLLHLWAAMHYARRTEHLEYIDENDFAFLLGDNNRRRVQPFACQNFGK